MIDRELVRRKIRLIAEDFGKIRELAAKDREVYLTSEIDELVAERLLERAIGRMIDINYHLIIENGGAPPSDYYASFTALAAIDVLPAEFARRIASCAGLRNRIVHDYDRLDPAKVHESLRTAVEEIPEYLRRINEFLDRA